LYMILHRRANPKNYESEVDMHPMRSPQEPCSIFPHP
jgi:hypothetical protein